MAGSGPNRVTNGDEEEEAFELEARPASGPAESVVPTTPAQPPRRPTAPRLSVDEEEVFDPTAAPSPARSIPAPVPAPTPKPWWPTPPHRSPRSMAAVPASAGDAVPLNEAEAAEAAFQERAAAGIPAPGPDEDEFEDLNQPRRRYRGTILAVLLALGAVGAIGHKKIGQMFSSDSKPAPAETAKRSPSPEPTKPAPRGDSFGINCYFDVKGGGVRPRCPTSENPNLGKDYTVGGLVFDSTGTTADRWSAEIEVTRKEVLFRCRTGIKKLTRDELKRDTDAFGETSATCYPVRK